MKTKVLLCLMMLGLLVASAQAPIDRTPGVQHKLKNRDFVVTEKVVDLKTDNTKPVQKAMARAAGVTHQVDFVLDYTETQQANFSLVNEDGTFDNYVLGLEDLVKGSNIVSIPEGTYDIIFTFYEIENMGTNFENTHHVLNVIREQVNIDRDMQLDVSSSEAKNHIHFQTLTIDGEPINTGTGRVDENWWVHNDNNGNVSTVGYISRAYCRDYGSVITKYASINPTLQAGDYQLSNGELCADFYVNDVSDRYAFGTYRIIVDYDFNFYTSYLEVQGGASADVTLANDPAKYQLYEDQFTASHHQGEDLYRKVDFWLKREGDFWYYTWGFMITNPPIDDGTTFKYYVSASADESKVGYRPYMQFSYNTKVTMETPWGFPQEELLPFITSPLITNTNETVVFANGSDIDHHITEWLFLEWDEQAQTAKDHPLWPPHPVFTYPVDNVKGALGNNCPIVSTYPKQYQGSFTWEDEDGNPVTENWIYNTLEYQYTGRNGETMQNHRNQAQITVDLNGENIYDGPGYEIVVDEEGFSSSERFLTTWFDRLFDGVVDVTITDEMVKVNDLQGANKAQLHYNAGAEDETPPTMTMLGFRDSNNDVTDCFATAGEGSVEFSAGDFNFWYTPDGDESYFRQAPEAVEVSYSPYGEDNWNELPIDEVPENYWPAMGWFYTGSLASVAGKGLNGWFDLKIRLTDAAGNWQEQVISPAFRIDDQAYSSVATVTADKGGDDAIYNLAGQRMRGDLNSLPHGIYIVGGKKVVK